MSPLKMLRYFFEALVAWAFFSLCRYLLPLKTSSNFGGWLARKIGRIGSISQRAHKSISKSFPNLSSQKVDEIVEDVWDNFGRLTAEYANADRYWDGKSLHNIEVVGLEHLKLFKDDGKPGVIFSAHIGHWQMITIVAKSIGFDLTQMYRPANNPWTSKLMVKCQKYAVKNVITKGNSGPKDLLHLINKGGHAFLLIDQKMREGIQVPFLGRPAMTATGIARIFLAKQCPLLPARCERVNKTSFRVTFYPPVEYKPTGDTDKDTYNLLHKINDIFSSWITERPGQWLWLHRRWDNP